MKREQTANGKDCFVVTFSSYYIEISLLSIRSSYVSLPWFSIGFAFKC